MITTVLIVASSVFLFSIYYMGIDPFFYRFLALLNIFTFCMLLLVSAGDLLQLIIGWELVGLCSYFLINY
jgi:NADH-quinone oxidoreductase subunit L